MATHLSHAMSRYDSHDKPVSFVVEFLFGPSICHLFKVITEGLQVHSGNFALAWHIKCTLKRQENARCITSSTAEQGSTPSFPSSA